MPQCDSQCEHLTSSAEDPTPPTGAMFLLQLWKDNSTKHIHRILYVSQSGLFQMQASKGTFPGGPEKPQSDLLMCFIYLPIFLSLLPIAHKQGHIHTH